MTYRCVDCNRSFKTDCGILAHCKAKGHECYKCGLCNDGDVVFKNKQGLDEHMEKERHNEPCCHESEQQVQNESATEQVQSSVDMKSRVYLTEQHVQHSQANQTYKCDMCNKTFKDDSSLRQLLHLHDSPAHKQVIRVIDNTFCSICEKRFKKPGDLQRHNSSPVHRDRNTPCFFGCSSKFKTPSGLAQHVESSCEQSPLSRHHITAAVQSLNIGSKISLRSSIEGSLSMPGTSRPVIEYQALESSFNGHSYQCPICSKTFRALHSLEAHLNSPAHDDDEFKCPKCNTHFALISGLVQHLESTSCKLSNIEDVERRLAKMTEQFSRSLRFEGINPENVIPGNRTRGKRVDYIPQRPEAISAENIIPGQRTRGKRSEEINSENIIPRASRRLRGMKRVDYTSKEALEKAGLLLGT